MNNYLKNIETRIDYKELMIQALETNEYEIFIDPLNGNLIKNWQIKKITDGYGYEISELFKKQFNLKDCRPRFYIQKPNSTIPFHVDRGTLCSLNILLSDNLAPITFKSGNIYYKSALLNTQEPHAVYTGAETRILYKISIFDKTYQELRDVLPSKLSF